MAHISMSSIEASSLHGNTHGIIFKRPRRRKDHARLGGHDGCTIVGLSRQQKDAQKITIPQNMLQLHVDAC